LWILFAGLALLLVPLRAAAQDLGTLDGTWQGDLAVIRTPTTVGPGRPYTVRIVITGATAHVFARDTSGGPFQEVKPGAFRVGRLGPSAIILSMDSGQDDEGTWIETWTFVVTLKAPNALITNLYRVVNNVDLPLSIDHSKFTEAEAGELARVK
jgi:hypothetical protein